MQGSMWHDAPSLTRFLEYRHPLKLALATWRAVGDSLPPKRVLALARLRVGEVDLLPRKMQVGGGDFLPRLAFAKLHMGGDWLHLKLAFA